MSQRTPTPKNHDASARTSTRSRRPSMRAVLDARLGNSRRHPSSRPPSDGDAQGRQQQRQRQYQGSTTPNMSPAPSMAVVGAQQGQEDTAASPSSGTPVPAGGRNLHTPEAAILRTPTNTSASFQLPEPRENRYVRRISRTLSLSEASLTKTVVPLSTMPLTARGHSSPNTPALAVTHPHKRVKSLSDSSDSYKHAGLASNTRAGPSPDDAFRIGMKCIMRRDKPPQPLPNTACSSPRRHASPHPSALEPFPDAMEYYRALEGRMAQCPISASVMAACPSWLPRMRARVFHWLADVCQHARMSLDTYFYAIAYFDTYASVRSSSLTTGKLQLLACACLRLASKIEETRVPSLRLLSRLTENTCDAEAIALLELELASVLRWRLICNTPLAWARFFIGFVHGDPCTVANGTVSTLDPAWFFRTTQVLQLAVCDTASLQFDSRQLAAAAVALCATRSMDILGVSGLSSSDLRGCLRWMHCFARVISDQGHLPVCLSRVMEKPSRAHLVVVGSTASSLKQAQALVKMLPDESKGSDSSSGGGVRGPPHVQEVPRAQPVLTTVSAMPAPTSSSTLSSTAPSTPSTTPSKGTSDLLTKIQADEGSNMGRTMVTAAWEGTQRAGPASPRKRLPNPSGRLGLGIEAGRGAKAPAREVLRKHHSVRSSTASSSATSEDEDEGEGEVTQQKEGKVCY